MSRVKGFTLLELLVTFTLLSVLLGLAVPAMSLWLQHQKSTALQYSLIHSINFSRTQSVTLQTNVTLCPGSENCVNEWGQEILIFADNNGNGFLENEEQLLKHLFLDNSAQDLSWSSFRRKPYLQFDATGLTTALNGTFHYCPRDSKNPYGFSISLAKTGRVRVKDPDC